jgi:hypothetical protein
MALTGYEKSRLNDYTISELKEIATTYYVTFKTPGGSTSTNYSRLNKNKLISAIENDRNYRRKGLELVDREDRPTDDNDNRVRKIMNDLIGIESQIYLMKRIREALKDTVTPVPDEGKFYTYVYKAKTPGIRYDMHPLIACTEVYSSGFTGFNYHWGKLRKYTWNEIQSNLYEVDAGEIADLRGIPYELFLNS